MFKQSRSSRVLIDVWGNDVEAEQEVFLSCEFLALIAVVDNAKIFSPSASL